MNTSSNLLRTTFTVFLFTGLSVGLQSVSAQVKIPAKSASSINNEDPNDPTVRTSDEATAPSLAANLTTDVIDETKVTAIQRVPPVTLEVNGAKIRRLAKLRRDLDIADAATQAKISLRTDTLFSEGEPESLDKLALPTLRKVVEYIELNDKKDVTVRSFYEPEEEAGKDLAWNRSLALIEWMTENSNLDLEDFKATGPSQVIKATPKPFATEIGDTEFVNRTEFVLE